MPDFRCAKARVARTFQNIRLFPGMTVLENLMVAQHNPLMGRPVYAAGHAGRPAYGGRRETLSRMLADGSTVSA